jgi:hypothetical protein
MVEAPFRLIRRVLPGMYRQGINPAYVRTALMRPERAVAVQLALKLHELGG